jgi:hypothetical protein
MPMLPAAPARFSMTKAWPIASAKCGWRMRAARSEAPPGAKGTITRTGRLGYPEAVCARAVAGAAVGASIAASSSRRRPKLVRILVPPVLEPGPAGFRRCAPPRRVLALDPQPHRALQP